MISLLEELITLAEVYKTTSVENTTLFPLMSRLANSVLGKDLVLAIFSPEGL
jgi:hypothetical protein